MDIFLLSLITLALAEMGDKTQLVLMYLGARFRRPLTVLAGGVVAATMGLGLAVLLGGWLASVMGPWLDWLIALGFITMAAWLWRYPPRLDGETDLVKVGRRGAFTTTVMMVLVMEMGDKTQLAALGLAAGFEQPAAVLAGAVIGISLVNAPVIWLGHRFADRLPQRLLQRISSGMFALVGIVLLVQNWPGAG